MHPAEFCEYHIKASLSFIFLSNSALALLLGIPYNVQRQENNLDLNQLVFDQGEVVQIITSSMIVVLVFCLFLYRVVPCCQFRVPNAVTFVMLAALSMLGACCLTTYGRGNASCKSDGPRNPTCYRRPDIDLSLTWFSVAISLTGMLSSFVLHLYDDAPHAWLRPDNDGHHLSQPTVRDSLELVKVQISSDGNDSEQSQREVPPCCPPPPYEQSPTLLSSYVLPSIPLRKRDMNKLGLTVITDIPMDSSFESPRKRWRGRGRDFWEKKPLGTSAKPEDK